MQLYRLGIRIQTISLQLCLFLSVFPTLGVCDTASSEEELNDSSCPFCDTRYEDYTYGVPQALYNEGFLSFQLA